VPKVLKMPKVERGRKGTRVEVKSKKTKVKNLNQKEQKRKIFKKKEVL
jgi:hypothetical protein